MKKLDTKMTRWECPICKKISIFPAWYIEEKLARCDNYKEHMKIEKQQLYNSIPQEKRQRFLDHFRKGKTVKESYEQAGLTQEQGFAVLDLNISSYHYLNEVTK